jgi:hypothetical protein
LYYLYNAHIAKDGTYLTGALVFMWILVLMNFIILWFFSSHVQGRLGRSTFDIGIYNVSKMSENRMPSRTIKLFFYNLLFILLIVTAVACDVSYLFDGFYTIKLPVIKLGTKNQWFIDLTCSDKTVTGDGNKDGSITYEDKGLCKDKYYNAIALSLILMSLIWFWVLVSSLAFYLKDQRSKVATVKDVNKDKRVWIQYVAFRVYRNPYIKNIGNYQNQSGMINFFLSPIYNLFTPGIARHAFPVHIQLTPKDADFG